MRRWLPIAPLVCCALFMLALPLSATEAEKGEQFYLVRIAPLLKKHCYRCHSAEAKMVEGALRLDDRDSILRGGDSGAAIDMRRPSDSLLLQAIRHENGYAMPPESAPLTAAEIRVFETWVKLGIPMPAASSPRSETAQWEQAKRHWAFQPLRKVNPPSVKSRDWPQVPLDRFVLKRLEDRGWQPSSAGTRSQWLRRVTFDLTGLPPTPDELQRFLEDRRLDAYQRVVDRLLASPRYGEKWAQFWLDLVRFAESEGYEYDRHLPGAWRYRDYVIDAWNKDKPFDEFVMQQLAGDEMSPDDEEHLAAAVFHRLGPVRRNAGNPEIALSRNEVLTERTDIIGDAFLGLSVRCARCHYHKLEPISQRDYYRLQAYLAGTREHNYVLADDQQQQHWQQVTDEVNDKIKALKEQLSKLAATAPQARRIRQEIAELEATLPPPLPTIPSVRHDREKTTSIHVLRRGIWENKGIAVAPRPPSVLVDDSYPELPAGNSQARTALARWLTTDNRHLVARVLVNRLWQHHFGRGIVATPNDFGTQGARPSHPELLDWLALQLLEDGWRMKNLHRSICLSATYRQRSVVSNDEGYAAADPENAFLWHVPRRRLSAEELRNAMLATSGELNLRSGGPSVIVPVEPALVQLLYKPTQWQVTADEAEHYRLSVYLLAKRNLRLPFMEVFDAPALQSSCPQRQSSTHAPQALELLNGQFASGRARALARRLRSEAGSSDEAMVRHAFSLTMAREPTPRELELSLQFLASEPVEEFALAMFNLNGFLYVR